jgi:hypothetical protein
MEPRTEGRITRGISWTRADEEIVQTMAARKHGGNVSQFLRELIRTEWNRRVKLSQPRKKVA